MYYVLIVHDTSPMVLNLEAKPLEQCQHDIAWQVKGGKPRSKMHICRYEPAHAGFVDIASGDVLKPRRSPFTEAAWDRFMSSLPKREGLTPCRGGSNG